MSIGDLLTILSIAIAVISIAYSSDRKIWLFKLSRLDMVIFVIWFLCANYLILFDSFYESDLFLPCLMKAEGFSLKPETWSYVITILYLVYLAYKVCRKAFPKSQYEKLTNYYKTLVDTNFSLLSSYLCEFHSKALMNDIEEFNKSMEAHNDSEADEFFPESHEESKEVNSTLSLPSLIFSKIIFTRAFIKSSISYQPLYFLTLVNKFQYSSIINSKECVQFYYSQLINERNVYLTNGLNSTISFLDTSKQESAYRLTDASFSRLTFENLKFTCRFEIWRAFGEEGLRDADTDRFFMLEENEWRDEQYVTTPAKICLRFYDIFLRELICNYYKSSEDACEYIYLHYLCMICQGVFNGGKDVCEKSYAHKFLKDLLSNMYSWLQCMKDYQRLQHQGEVLCIAENMIKIDDFPELIRVEASCWLLETFLELSSELNDKKEFVENFLRVITRLIKNEKMFSEGWKKMDVCKCKDSPYYPKLQSYFEAKGI